MNLKALQKPILLERAKELRLDVSDAVRKPKLIEAILAVGADDDELSECIEAINEREKFEREQRELELERQREQEKLALKREKQQRELERQHELEMKSLDFDAVCARNRVDSSEPSSVAERLSFKMTDLMRPYKIGEDIRLFLVNFKRTCEFDRSVGFGRD